MIFTWSLLNVEMAEWVFPTHVWGYVHTVRNRFLLHFKSCFSTVRTRINVLLQCRNCSRAFPVWTEALSVIQFAMLPFDSKRSFTVERFCCNFCSDKSGQTVSKTYPIRNVPVSTAKRSSTVPEQKLLQK